MFSLLYNNYRECYDRYKRLTTISSDPDQEYDTPSYHIEYNPNTTTNFVDTLPRDAVPMSVMMHQDSSDTDSNLQDTTYTQWPTKINKASKHPRHRWKIDESFNWSSQFSLRSYLKRKFRKATHTTSDSPELEATIPWDRHVRARTY